MRIVVETERDAWSTDDNKAHCENLQEADK